MRARPTVLRLRRPIRYALQIHFLPPQHLPAAIMSRTGSTISFNGSGAQTIPSFRYNNLQTATGGTKTAGGALVIYGNMTIGSSSTVDGSSTIDTLYGNWINNGTFTPTTSEIVFAGPSNSSISGATSFNNLTVNKSSFTTNVALSNNIQAVNVSMATGTMGTGPSNTVTITDTERERHYPRYNNQNTSIYCRDIVCV